MKAPLDISAFDELVAAGVDRAAERKRHSVRDRVAFDHTTVHDERKKAARSAAAHVDQPDPPQRPAVWLNLAVGVAAAVCGGVFGSITSGAVAVGLGLLVGMACAAGEGLLRFACSTVPDLRRPARAGLVGLVLCLLLGAVTALGAYVLTPGDLRELVSVGTFLLVACLIAGVTWVWHRHDSGVRAHLCSVAKRERLNRELEVITDEVRFQEEYAGPTTVDHGDSVATPNGASGSVAVETVPGPAPDLH